jgi:HAD superfamily hydrolase (TIGR01509 family)
MHTAFVVDADGTLFDTEGHWSTAERLTTEIYGAKWTAAMRQATLGRSVDQTAALIGEHVAAPATDVYDMIMSLYRGLISRNGVHSMPGASLILSNLAARGIPRAVASNSPQELVLEGLSKADLAKWIQTVVCPSETVRAKPQPDTYALACERLNVEPQCAVAIEDSRTGVTAARRAGLLTIAVGPTAEALGAHYAFESLLQVDVDRFTAIAVRR